MTNLTTGRSDSEKVTNGKRFVAITGSNYGSGVTIDWSADDSGNNWITLQDEVGTD